LQAPYLVHLLVGSFNHVLHPQKEMMIPDDCSVFQIFQGSRVVLIESNQCQQKLGNLKLHRIFGMILQCSPGACGKTNIQPICFHKWTANDSPKFCF
jgi:hypothetical protein